ncbi:hypothetical protein [Ureaplasma urealyticum]|uniref:hypothetical protein n=1 Tax=Ureaplasma urealyticum TaxID=2130 RepID=UPI0021B1A51A|nr:hypothetical protein [Ureaplasma urealyticum]
MYKFKILNSPGLLLISKAFTSGFRQPAITNCFWLFFSHKKTLTFFHCGLLIPVGTFKKKPKPPCSIELVKGWTKFGAIVWTCAKSNPCS